MQEEAQAQISWKAVKLFAGVRGLISDDASKKPEVAMI